MWVEIRPFSRRQVWEKLEISVCRGNICRNSIGLHTVDSHTIGSHNSIMQQCYNDFMELSVPKEAQDGGLSDGISGSRQTLPRRPTRDEV